MISATFDTSVYIRAINFGGPAALLLGHAKAGTFRLDTSEFILSETARVLRYKFKQDGYSIYDSDQRLRGICNLVTPTEKLDVIKEDQDDNRILECVSAARSDYIVSEDKDLLRLGQFEGAKIVATKEFLEVVLIRGKER